MGREEAVGSGGGDKVRKFECSKLADSSRAQTLQSINAMNLGIRKKKAKVPNGERHRERCLVFVSL